MNSAHAVSNATSIGGGGQFALTPDSWRYSSRAFVRETTGVATASMRSASAPDGARLNVITYVQFSQKNGTQFGDATESAFRLASDAWRRHFQKISTTVAEYYPAMSFAMFKPDSFDYERDVYFAAPSIFGGVEALGHAGSVALPTTKQSGIVTETRDQLDYLSRYQAGWNGPRSKAPSPVSFELANRFLSCISDASKLVEIAPLLFSNGRAVLEIQTQLAFLRLEFVENGEIYVNLDDADSSLDLDLEGFAGGSLPPELLQYL